MNRQSEEVWDDDPGIRQVESTCNCVVSAFATHFPPSREHASSDLED